MLSYIIAGFSGLSYVQLQSCRLDQDCAHGHSQLAFRRAPYCCYVRQTNGQTRPARQIAMTGRGIPVRISDLFWSNTSAISSRSRQKGLQYAVEGYIQNIKIRNEGDTTTIYVSIEANAYRCSYTSFVI